METLTTKGIQISVNTFYRKDQSDPMAFQFIFGYHVSIENLSNHPVQLLSRHWVIYDSIGSSREVNGEGVVGQQPVIQPGERHEYQSWCPLTSDMGYMEGSYLMSNLHDRSTFRAIIPKFNLVAPYKYS